MSTYFVQGLSLYALITYTIVVLDSSYSKIVCTHASVTNSDEIVIFNTRVSILLTSSITCSM